MTTPEELSEAEMEAKKEWEGKNEEFKVRVMDEMDSLLRTSFRNDQEVKSAFENDPVFEPIEGDSEEELEESWQDFLTYKIKSMFDDMKKEYLEKHSMEDNYELSRYSAWQICSIGIPDFEWSPKFDLDGEKSIVKFFKEKLEGLKKENQE